MMVEAEISVMSFGDGGKSYKPWHIGRNYKLQKVIQQILPSEIQEETRPADTLILAQ